MYICVYVYIYMRICIYIHIYIYTHRVGMNDGRSDNHTFFQLPRNAMLNPPQIAHGPHRSGRSLMSKVEPTAWRWSMAVRVTATIWPLGWWKQSIAIGWPIQKHCTRKKKKTWIFPDYPVKSHGTVVGLAANIISQFQPWFTHWVPDDFFICLSPIAPALGPDGPSRDQRIRIPQRVTPIAGWFNMENTIKKNKNEHEWWISACSCNSKLMFHVIV